MLTEIDGGYDEGYRAITGFWGTSPSSVVVDFLSKNNVANLRILDAGAGEGKNAAAFARLGAVVEAIECSAAAIKNGRLLFSQEKIDWLHADITAVHILAESYDVVVCYGLVHCMSSEKAALDLLAKTMAGVRRGGVFILASFNAGTHDLSAHPGFRPLLLPHQWFLDVFTGWHTDIATDSILFETHPHNQIPHHHSLTRILARKP